MSALHDLLKLILESILVKTIRIFHRHSREINSFLQSNNSVSRTNYYRIFMLASIDISLTLPIGIINIALALVAESVGYRPFYKGWTAVHRDWEPVSVSYEEFLEGGTSHVARQYFIHWTSPILAFVIFALFGVTKEARASYWIAIRTVLGWLGWKPTLLPHAAHSSPRTIEPREGPQGTSTDLDAR